MGEEIAVEKELTEEEKAKKAAKKEKKMLEKANPLKKHQILYDNLAILNPNKMDELKADISSRIGIKAEKIRIRKINLVAGNAEIDVFYRVKKQEPADE